MGVHLRQGHIERSSSVAMRVLVSAVEKRWTVGWLGGLQVGCPGEKTHFFSSAAGGGGQGRDGRALGVAEHGLARLPLQPHPVDAPHPRQAGAPELDRTYA